MHTLTRTPRKLLLAGTILAMAAMLMALLLASGSGASAKTTASDLAAPGSGLLPQQDEPQTEPEACNPNPVEVITGGAFALFDVYWDTGDRNLVNNPCPPAVVHTVHTETTPSGIPGVPGTTTTTVETARSPSNIDIRHTIIHIPDSEKFTLVEAGDPQEHQEGFIGVDTLSPLWEFYNPSEDNPAGLPRVAWVLREWEAERPSHPEVLHLGFSAGLLKDAEWDGEIEYEFEVFREPGVGPADRGAMFASDNPDFSNPDWDTLNPDVNDVSVAAAEYKHRAWAFARPGTYVIAVHAKGHPQKGPGKLLPADSTVEGVTSAVRHYTFHVGNLANVSVDVGPIGDLAPGQTISLSVYATNNGPDPATDTKVNVKVTDGLSFVEPPEGFTPGTGDKAGTGVWTVGTLADDETRSISLNIQAAQNTHGKEQTVTAEISATETIGSSRVVELDPRRADNTDTSSITPTVEQNENVVFGVTGQLAENASADTVVTTNPWVPHDPDTTAFRYTLTGDDADHFVVDQDTGVLSVADDADLNYECKTAYVPLLQVSDGKDEAGNANDWAVDAVLAMVINLDDQQETAPTVQISKSAPDDRGAVTLTPVVTPGSTLCAPLEDYHYDWDGDLADRDRNKPTITVIPFGNEPIYAVRVTITDATGRSVTVQDSVRLDP